MADVTAGGRTIPIVQEEAFVDKRRVETEHVRVQTSIVESDVIVRDTVAREHVEVKRVAIDREVSGPQPIREEDGVTIVPVLEERLVVEKRLFLVEEIHLLRSHRLEPVALPITLRHTQVDVERNELNDKQEDFNGRT